MVMKRLLPVVVCVLGAASGARGALFWRTWEGYKYPEQELWQRFARGGGAERTLSNGMLTLDGTASGAIVDEYYWETPLIVAPGQYFRAAWRMRVEDVEGPTGDPAFAVTADDHGGVFLIYDDGAIYSLLEAAWICNFAPGVFHKYSFTSPDMVTYDLRIDGQLAYSGHFLGPSPTSGVCWGDCGEGASSLSVWDYVRFGVVSACAPAWGGHVSRGSNDIQLGNVPEPSAGLLLGSVGLAAIGLGVPRSRRYRR